MEFVSFMLLQRTPNGMQLATPSMDQFRLVVPGLTTVIFSASPPQGIYAQYAYRTLYDPIMVPGSLRFTVMHYGAEPYVGTFFPGSMEHYVDKIIRITEASPSRFRLQNLSPLMQQFVVHIRSILVSSRENDDELWRRLERNFGLTAPEIVVSAEHVVVDMSRVESRLDQVATGLEQVIAGLERLEGRRQESPRPAVRPDLRRQVIGPLSEAR